MLGRRARRHLLVGTGAVAAAVSLTSCDPVPTTAPLALSVTDGGVLVAICDASELRDFLVEFRPTVDAPWETVFEAEGGPVPVVDTAMPDSRLSVTTSEPFEVTGSSIVAVLFSDAARPADVSYEAEFRIPASGLGDADWIYPDGSIGTDRCR